MVNIKQVVDEDKAKLLLQPSHQSTQVIKKKKTIKGSYPLNKSRAQARSSKTQPTEAQRTGVESEHPE